MSTNRIIGKSFANEILADLPSEIYAFCDFRGAQLNSIDLAGKQFVGCNFGNSLFVSVNLTKTTFNGCFSCVSEKIYATDCRFESATMINTHFVIDADEDSEMLITIWDNDTEELLHDAQNVIDYTIIGKIDTLLNHGHEKLLFFGLHWCVGMFVEDGYQRSWILRNLIRIEIHKSSVYGELFRLFIVSFLGDEYVGVSAECKLFLPELKPDSGVLEFGINRIFSSEDSEISKGLRQLRTLLYLGYVDLVNNQLEERIEFLSNHSADDESEENKISYLSDEALEDIEYFRNKNT
jgi:hypothetical protein